MTSPLSPRLGLPGRVATALLAALLVAAPGLAPAASAASSPTAGAASSPTASAAPAPASADLGLNLIAAPNPVGPGRTLTYRVTVGNHGPGAASAVVASLAIPSGTTYESVSAPRGWTLAAPPVGGTGEVTASADSLAPDDPALIFVSVHVADDTPEGTTISASASVTSATADPNPADNEKSVDVRVATPPRSTADPGIAFDPPGDAVPVNGQIVYSIVVANGGPQFATDVTVTMPTPAGTTFAFAFASHGSITAPAPGEAGTITFSLVDISPRKPLVATVGLRVTAAAGSTINAVARVASSSIDTNANNNTATFRTRVVARGPSADLSVQIAGSAPAIVTGSELTYTVTVANAGPAPATGNSVIVPVPATARFLSASSATGNMRTPPIGSTGAVVWRTGPIESGGTATLDVTARIVADGGTRLEDTAYVSCGIADPDATNDAASVETRVQSAGSTVLVWSTPDPTSAETNPPPGYVSTDDQTPPPGKASAEPTPSGAAASGGANTTAPSTGELVCYNVYRTASPTEQPDPSNIFASVPANQTSIPGSVAANGSYYLVTACYTTGESSAPGAVGVGTTPGATITTIKLVGTKIIAKGSGFTADTDVLLDGLAFADASSVKNGKTKVVQKGLLETGQTIEQYLAGGESFLLTFRNDDGGIVTATVVPQSAP